MDDHEVIAQQVSTLGDRVSALERRMDEVEKVNARMEEATLSTARALAEISDHWDQVYEAIRRRNVSQQAPE
jgi:hypothetical protein